MKVCDAMPGTLYVVSEEDGTITENNRFQAERFNFELAFNLLLSKLFKVFKIKVKKPLKKPFTINLAQRRIQKDRDQSKYNKIENVTVKKTFAWTDQTT